VTGTIGIVRRVLPWQKSSLKKEHKRLTVNQNGVSLCVEFRPKDTVLQEKNKKPRVIIVHFCLPWWQLLIRRFKHLSLTPKHQWLTIGANPVRISLKVNLQIFLLKKLFGRRYRAIFASRPLVLFEDLEASGGIKRKNGFPFKRQSQEQLHDFF